MIKLENLTKIYEIKNDNKVTALSNINLEIGDTGLVFILGKSGSGKSTLLNILGGLDTVTSGNYIVNGRNTTDFKDIDYDSFRNTSVGFVFQEFNVLEKYTVYENIALAYELQNKKANREEILKLLEELGIKDLENRKMNELSGGQKQRVAIARALIKKSQIILADEPTGNLDSVSSAQIFQILKSISKERLVIVVSHDRESARNYADRIIGIKDGQIEYDNGVTYNSESSNLELKKSKLPFKYAVKMAVENLKHKKSKLVMSIILTAVAFAFLSIGINFVIFNKNSLIMQTIKNNDINVYLVNKYNYKSKDDYDALDFENEDYEYIENLTGSKINNIYNFYEDDNLKFEYINENDRKNEYFYLPSNPYILDVKEDKIFDNIIGRKPNVNNEIVVSKYFADYVIKYGVRLYNEEEYFPKDYNDLISSNKEIKYGDNKVIVVGIMNEDDSIFKSAKEAGYFSDEKLKNFYGQYSMDFLRDIIYTKNFIDTIELKDREEDITDNILNYIYIVNYSDLGISGNIHDNINFLNNEIEIMTNDGIKTINSINKDEMILSLNSIRKLFNNFDTEYMDYIKENSDKSLLNFAIKFLEGNQKRKNVTLQYNKDGIKEFAVKIIGITEEDTNYISDFYKDELNEHKNKLKIKDDYILVRLIYDDDYSHMKKVLSNLTYFSSDGIDEYDIYTPNIKGIHYTYQLSKYYMESDIYTVTHMYSIFSIIILIVAFVFFIFAFLLFTNYISMSIMNSKKEIGILRSLGASKNDVSKIFSLESIMIGLISSLISVIFFIISSIVIGNYLSSDYYNFTAVVFQPIVILITAIISILISIFISSLNSRKISKLNPIDAILNK